METLLSDASTLSRLQDEEPTGCLSARAVPPMAARATVQIEELPNVRARAEADVGDEGKGRVGSSSGIDAWRRVAEGKAARHSCDPMPDRPVPQLRC